MISDRPTTREWLNPGLLPREASIWQHTNGNLYMVVVVTNLDSQDQLKYPPMVVYATHMSPEFDTRYWSRPLFDWHRSFTKVTES